MEEGDQQPPLKRKHKPLSPSRAEDITQAKEKIFSPSTNMASRCTFSGSGHHNRISRSTITTQRPEKKIRSACLRQLQCNEPLNPFVTCQHFFSKSPTRDCPRHAANSRDIPRLADEAQAAQAQVENEQRVHRKPDPVLHNTAAAEDANTSRHGPGDEHQVDRDPGDLRQVQRRQEGGDDDREERVPDNADALRERTVSPVSASETPQSAPQRCFTSVSKCRKKKKRTHIFPPNNLICSVTTASPIQTIAKTPLNTSSR